jgi:hypothetical protein
MFFQELPFILGYFLKNNLRKTYNQTEFGKYVPD